MILTILFCLAGLVVILYMNLSESAERRYKERERIAEIAAEYESAEDVDFAAIIERLKAEDGDE